LGRGRGAALMRGQRRTGSSAARQIARARLEQGPGRRPRAHPGPGASRPQRIARPLQGLGLPGRASAKPARPSFPVRSASSNSPRLGPGTTRCGSAQTRPEGTGRPRFCVARSRPVSGPDPDGRNSSAAARYLALSVERSPDGNCSAAIPISGSFSSRRHVRERAGRHSMAPGVVPPNAKETVRLEGGRRAPSPSSDLRVRAATTSASRKVVAGCARPLPAASAACRRSSRRSTATSSWARRPVGRVLEARRGRALENSRPRARIGRAGPSARGPPAWRR